MISTFDQVQKFLESWGLHFDTPDGESNDIPYPQVYSRMKEDALLKGGSQLARFVSSMTDTTDGRTYLVVNDWEQLQEYWVNR